MNKFFILLAASLAANWAEAAVRIVDPVFREYEDGPPIAKSFKHQPGDTVYLTFQIADFKVTGEERKVSLSYELEARDPEQLLLTNTKKGTVKVELAHEDKDWRPKIRVEAPVPASAPGGTYHILLQVQDENDKSEAKLDVPFEVSGAPFEAAPKIMGRQIEFLRNEEDKAALASRSYHPGDTVWLRFTFAGYKMGPKNKLHVQYGLALKAEDGRVLFSQPTAADLEEEGFYPRRTVPAILNIKLDPNIAKGDYTLLLVVRDLISAETVEYPEIFHVE